MTGYVALEQDMDIFVKARRRCSGSGSAADIAFGPHVVGW